MPVNSSQIARWKREELLHGAKTSGKRKMDFPPKYHEPMGMKWRRWMDGIVGKRKDQAMETNRANDGDGSEITRQDTLPEYIA